MSTVTDIQIDAPSVCFETCSSYRDDHEADGFCAACGWAADDHTHDAGLAEAA